jgi:hypothetical protein
MKNVNTNQCDPVWGPLNPASIKPQECEHKRIESNMVPQQCADCGIEIKPQETQDWATVRKNLIEFNEKYPNFEDCIDSAYLHGLESSRKDLLLEIEEKAGDLIESIDKPGIQIVDGETMNSYRTKLKNRLFVGFLELIKKLK